MTSNTTNTPISTDTNTLIEERRSKLTQLRQNTTIAFPNDFRRTHLSSDLQEQFNSYSKEDLETLDDAKQNFAVAGRMMLKRVMGKASFATLQDKNGRIQVYISNDGVGIESHDAFKHYDLGDILGVTGTIFKTKTGELSLKATSIRLLTKALRPLPEKFHGLTDQEQKYRQRYVDLITNEDTRKTFMIRSKVIQAIRQFFIENDYLEVETPMMHVIPGGASAKPFITHHNALDMPLFLRIAPELYLKRLVVGGFEKVFEINRNFRNEGVSTRHNPEFTMLEFYEAYQDYQYLMNFTERLFKQVSEQVLGTCVVNYQGHEIDLGKAYDRLTVENCLKKYHEKYQSADLTDRTYLASELKKFGVEVKDEMGIGSLQLMLFEETTEHLLIQPTFIIDYPAEVSPLARRNDTQTEITDRFELYIAGREVANGFSELNDPEDQAERFLQQVAQKDAGDDEAMHYDADYIRALEYGLPPTAGQGIGIDRFIMLLTDSSNIRDVILFPHMRAE